VPLAGFQCHAAVTLLAGQVKTLQVDQRFVDHHGQTLGDPMHCVLGMGLQITMRRLLDVLDPLDRSRSLLLQLIQHGQHVIGILAPFIEIEREGPRFVCGTAPVSCLTDGPHAGHVPIQIVAGELDLQMGQPVSHDPLLQRFRQAVVDGRRDIGGHQGIKCPDQMIQRQRSDRLCGNELLQPQPLEGFAQINAQIVGQVIGPQQFIRTFADRLAMGIEQCGFQR
jgi:hypothetical protein